jgi:hypothetical protein
MITSAISDGPKATRTRSRGCGGPAAVGSVPWIGLTRRAVSGEWRATPGQDDDVGPDGGSEDSGGWLETTGAGGE